MDGLIHECLNSCSTYDGKVQGIAGIDKSMALDKCFSHINLTSTYKLACCVFVLMPNDHVYAIDHLLK